MSLTDLSDDEIQRLASGHFLRRLRAPLSVVGCLGLIALLLLPGFRLLTIPLWIALSVVAMSPSPPEREVKRRFGPTIKALTAGATGPVLVSTARFRPHGARAAARFDLTSGAVELWVLDRGDPIAKSGRRGEGTCDATALLDLLQRADLSSLEAGPVRDGVPVSITYIDAEQDASGWQGSGTTVQGDAAGVELVQRVLTVLADAAREQT